MHFLSNTDQQRWKASLFIDQLQTDPVVCSIYKFVYGICVLYSDLYRYITEVSYVMVTHESWRHDTNVVIYIAIYNSTFVL
jgi:hypothetical protein